MQYIHKYWLEERTVGYSPPCSFVHSITNSRNTSWLITKCRALVTPGWINTEQLKNVSWRHGILTLVQTRPRQRPPHWIPLNSIQWSINTVFYETKGFTIKSLRKCCIDCLNFCILKTLRSPTVKTLRPHRIQYGKRCSQDCRLVKRWREYRHPKWKDRIKQVVFHVLWNTRMAQSMEASTFPEVSLLSNYLIGCHVMCMQYFYQLSSG